jgi:hypothetical protein
MINEVDSNNDNRPNSADIANDSLKSKTNSFPNLPTTTRFILPLIIFCWPLFYLFHQVFPIKGQYTAMGNDFYLLYYLYKVYLLANLANWHFPFWSPSEGGGFPFYTSPFVQAFYPLNILLTIWYRISGGYNPHDHQVFAILGISIFALGLYTWLQLLQTNIRSILFSVLVLSISFKVTEILRFPNAVHTAAWYPWILYAVTKIMLNPSSRNRIVNGILLIFFGVCLCTSGYPYYLYYSLFLFIPYLLIFLIKPLRIQLLPSPIIDFRGAFKTLITCAVIIFLICAPYLIGIKQLMAETTDRSGANFNYSTANIFNIEDTIGSLIYPPAAQLEGIYFFSITGFLIICLYLMSGLLGIFNGNQNIKNGANNTITCFGNSWIILFFISWIGLISYISYGRDSYLFIFLWKFMPGFSSLREWGRVNIILVPILAWLMTYAYSYFESVISGQNTTTDEKNKNILSPSVIMICIYAVVLSTQLYFYWNAIVDPYWPRYVNDHSSSLYFKFILRGTGAFILLFIIMSLGAQKRIISNYSRAAVLSLLIIGATIEMYPVGTYFWTSHGTHTWASQSDILNQRIYLNDVVKLNESSFQFQRNTYAKTASISLGPNFNAGIFPSWYFGRYVKFIKDRKEVEADYLNILLGVSYGNKIYFSESIDHNSIKSFLNDSMRFKNLGHLISYTGDELIWDLNASTNGYFSFIDNWDSNWKAYIDNQPVKIELLFGTFKSVKVVPGRHIVRFTYQPGFLRFIKTYL